MRALTPRCGLPKLALILAVPLLALAATWAHLVWMTHGPHQGHLHLALDACAAAGLDPAQLGTEGFADLLYGEPDPLLLPRYRAADNLMRVVMLCGALFAAVLGWRAWLDRRGWRGRRGRLRSALVGLAGWGALAAVFLLGLVDTGEDVEIFGSDDNKHVVYLALAGCFWIWLVLRYRRLWPSLLFLGGLLLHGDYLLSEALSGRWGESITMVVFRDLLAPLMDPRVAAHPDVVHHALRFDVENAMNKNLIALAYTLSFGVLVCLGGASRRFGVSSSHR